MDLFSILKDAAHGRAPVAPMAGAVDPSETRWRRKLRGTNFQRYFKEV